LSFLVNSVIIRLDLLFISRTHLNLIIWLTVLRFGSLLFIFGDNLIHDLIIEQFFMQQGLHPINLFWWGIFEHRIYQISFIKSYGLNILAYNGNQDHHLFVGFRLFFHELYVSRSVVRGRGKFFCDVHVILLVPSLSRCEESKFAYNHHTASFKLQILLRKFTKA
jgi:hypothetical protein